MKWMNRQIQKERRKELRSNATISEKRLWKFLNKKQQDFKFRRQHGIGPYIVDFYLAIKKWPLGLMETFMTTSCAKLMIKDDKNIYFQKESKSSDSAMMRLKIILTT
jgi:hypothetical protein